MENVTHSLAGLLLAEAAVRLRARTTGTEPSARFRTVAAVSSLVAANLPDADLFYTGVGGDRLAYMLHHRGYTHTVVVALAGALLAWGAAWLVWRRRAHAPPPRADARWLLGLLLVSTLGHLVLDWTNSYGVHPFWPVDDRWRYGDAVFIVEPWFWVVAVPPLVAASPRRLSRALLSLLLAIGLVLAWRVSHVTTGAAVALTAGALLSIGLARALRPGPRAAVAVGGWIAVTLALATGARAARAAVTREVRAAAPAADLLDVVVTPLPSNAVCARVIAVERERETYRVVTGRASAVPRLAPAARCGDADDAGPRFGTPTRPSSPAVQWDAEWTAPAAELATLARASCPALAALRFIRVPAWRALPDSTVLLGDVRYGDLSGRGFTDVTVPRRSAACPAAVPPWVPPRAELLGE
ncbi:MAG TPA: metal-dependent hydrolase [Gemmatimonadales bacterium]|nr:metal-dependent hydrolase [Gemmatimonadales bacterium]